MFGTVFSVLKNNKNFKQTYDYSFNWSSWSCACDYEASQNTASGMKYTDNYEEDENGGYSSSLCCKFTLNEDGTASIESLSGTSICTWTLSAENNTVILTTENGAEISLKFYFCESTQTTAVMFNDGSFRITSGNPRFFKCRDESV